MMVPNPQRRGEAGTSVFVVSCWVLGLVVLVQLWVGGVALAVRLKESRQVRVVEREVIKPVLVQVPVEAVPPVEVAQSGAGVLGEATSGAVANGTNRVPTPTPLGVPAVADPRAERLLAEAREARVAGDMGKAIVKLEQALEHAPADPSLVYELGLVHEQMGVFDQASRHFEQVFQMGVSGAGSLYGLAAAKLRDGFAQPEDMLGRLSLGRVRIFNQPKHEAGQQVILTIPVQKAPADEVDVSAIQVEVRFFNRTSRGDIVELDDPSLVTSRWVTLPFDWAGGEENLRMTYTLPPVDRQTEHLFGKREYYGQVVTLSYQGEVLDVQAWPRDLAAKIVKQPEAGVGDLPVPEFLDSLPPDFDPAIPLLPSR